MAEWSLKYADARGEIHQQVAEAGSERELRERYEGLKQEHARREDEVVRNFAKLMVKEGRRALALKHHPDKGGSRDDMIAINAAEQRLSSFIEQGWDPALYPRCFEVRHENHSTN